MAEEMPLLDRLLVLENRRARSDPGERDAMVAYLRMHERRFAATLDYLAGLELTGPRVFSEGSHPGHLEVLLKDEQGLDICGSAFGPQGLAVEDWSAAQDGALTFDSHHLDFGRDTLPFDAQSFDAVFNFEMLEHLIAAPYLLLFETNRVLRLGGLLVISTPNAQYWRRFLALARGIKYPDEDFHELPIDRHNYLYSLHKITEVLWPFGFDVVGHAFEDCLDKPMLGSTSELAGPLEAAIVEAGATEPRYGGDTLFITAKKTRPLDPERVMTGRELPELAKGDMALRVGALEAELKAMRASRSWRITRPLRRLTRLLRGGR